MSRQGIVACGYYGFANVGDEAVLAGLLNGLKQAGYLGSVTVMSADPPHTQREHGTQAILRTDLRAVWRAMRRCRVFVLGGGSLLQDVTSARSVVYYLGMHALARRAGCRIAWIGQGIGPLQRAWTRRWTACAARQADAIAVRDPDSAKWLQARGQSQVVVGADLSFLLPDADTDNGWKVLHRFGVEQNEALIAMAPRAWAGQRELVVELFASLARHALEQWGARAVLLAMQATHDKDLVQEVACKVSQAVVLGELLSVREVRDVLACCRAVVGMRLHAMMLAAASGVPGLALSYDPKVRAFWQPVEAKHVVELAEATESRLRRQLTEIWGQLPQLRERVTAYAVQQRQLASRNIDVLLPLIT